MMVAERTKMGVVSPASTDGINSHKSKAVRMAVHVRITTSGAQRRTCFSSWPLNLPRVWNSSMRLSLGKGWEREGKRGREKEREREK